ncbi:MAG: hypothetical protein QM820_28360 [Minicystis sp.]
MPVTSANMANRVYFLNPLNPPNVLVNGPVRRYAIGNRMNHNEVAPGAGSNVYQVNFALAAGGDTFFLPYGNDQIHAIRLPAAAGPVTTVLTANLSGCAIFIERKQNNDVVFYHANGVTDALTGAAVSPTALESSTQPTFQTGGAYMRLFRLYEEARAHYPGAVTEVRALFKGEYNRPVLEEMARKWGHGRTDITLAAGTTVGAFWQNARWEFFYQTYGGLEYRRPVTAPKGWFQGRDRQVNVNADMRVLGCQMFYHT